MYRIKYIENQWGFWERLAVVLPVRTGWKIESIWEIKKKTKMRKTKQKQNQQQPWASNFLQADTKISCSAAKKDIFFKDLFWNGQGGWQ